MLEIGDKLPDVTLKTQDDERVTISSFKGKRLIIYIYPKDDTPGCTVESKEFSDLAEAFKKANAIVIGLSKDTPKSHKKFCQKYNLAQTLLSDPSIDFISILGAWKEKSMYGKKYMGISRTTVIADENGEIEKIYKKVSPKGHAKQVLDALKQ